MKTNNVVAFDDIPNMPHTCSKDYESEAPPEWATESIPDENDPVMYVPEGMSPEDVNRNIFVKKEAESSELKEYLKKYCDEGNEIELCPSTNEFGLENDVNFFPDIMSGVAGDFAELYGKHFESPKQFFYMAFLTCLGSFLPLTLKTSTKTQPRLYTLLLGQSGDSRKSTAIKQTSSLFRDAVSDFGFSKGVNSAEGLQAVLKKHPSLLLSFDEMKLFVDKCKIQGSVLLSCVNSLYEDNEYHSATKTTQMEIEDAHLSLLCASTIDTYEKTWDSQFTAIGFNNRQCIVPGDGERKFAFPDIVPELERSYIMKRIKGIREIVGDGLEMGYSKAARDRYSEWYFARPKAQSARTEGMAERFMMLIAINDCKTVIDEGIVDRATKLVDWQMAVRKKYDPVDADSIVAKLEERVRRSLRAGPKKKRQVEQDTHARREGVWMLDQALNNLIRNEEIVYDRKTKMYSRIVE